MSYEAERQGDELRQAFEDGRRAAVATPPMTDDLRNKRAIDMARLLVYGTTGDLTFVATELAKLQTVDAVLIFSHMDRMLRTHMQHEGKDYLSSPIHDLINLLRDTAHRRG